MSAPRIGTWEPDPVSRAHVIAEYQQAGDASPLLMVSIVTGTWNRSSMLSRLFRSIWEDMDTADRSMMYETIVVDAGSTDGTLEWLREHMYDGGPKDRGEFWNSLTVINQGEPLGAAKAFDAGFAAARGKYVVSLNDDCIIHPSAIPAAVALLEADPTIGQVAIPYRNPDPDTRIYCRFVRLNGREYTYANFGVTRKELGDRLSWWRHDIYKQYGGDTHISVAIAEAGFRVASLEGAGFVDHLEAQDATRRSDNADAETFFAYWRQRAANPDPA